MSFGSFSQGGHSAPNSEINMVPLIDVMLVLLIIFMITAPLLTHAVKIDLPHATSEPSIEKPETVTLALDADGNFFWNDQPISDSALGEKLNTIAQQHPQPSLHLRADQNTRYQKLAQIMSAARSAGVEKIGFITVPETH